MLDTRTILSMILAFQISALPILATAASTLPTVTEDNIRAQLRLQDIKTMSNEQLEIGLMEIDSLMSKRQAQISAAHARNSIGSVRNAYQVSMGTAGLSVMVAIVGARLFHDRTGNLTKWGLGMLMVGGTTFLGSGAFAVANGNKLQDEKYKISLADTKMTPEEVTEAQAGLDKLRLRISNLRQRIDLKNQMKVLEDQN